MFSFAGVIMTTNDERIENVSIQSETDSTIVYLQKGVKKSIAIEQISGILYDNGKYREFTSKFIDPKSIVDDETPKSSISSSTQDAKSEQQRKEERQQIEELKKCQKAANKLFNKTFQEVYSKSIAEGYTQNDAKTKAREEANFVKNQSLKECMGIAE